MTNSDRNMTKEEKARAYDEALEKAKELLGSPRTCFDIEQLTDIFPELRESEDEKIRKSLIQFLTGEVHEIDVEKTLAWLEKQKEEEGYEAIPVESTLEYKLGFKAGKESEKQKEHSLRDFIDDFPYSDEQKEQSITVNDLDEEIHRFFDNCIDVHDVKLYGNISERVIPVNCYELTARHFAKWGKKQKEDKEELVYRLNGLMQDYIKEGKDDEEKEHRFKCYQLFWNALEDANFFEQKEPEKYTETRWENDTLVVDCSKQKPANNYHEWRNIVYYVLKEWLGIGQYMDMAPFNDIVKTLQEKYSLPKPAEWSEEDEKMLQSIIERGQSQIRWLDTGLRPEQVDWLKDLRPSSKPSEEEIEEMVNERATKSGTTKSEMAFYRNGIKDAIKRFNLHLQPKQEWSEKDENNLNKLLQWDGIPLSLRDWVSGLPEKVCTRPSWKPSKEEMEALDVACSGKLWYGDIYLEGLKRIREQLRKLYNHDTGR